MPKSRLEELVTATICKKYPWLKVQENVRPEWLIMDDGTRLELDIYIEELSLAVEVQGVQHFEYVPHFHGDELGFQRQLERDALKRELCEGLGVTLVPIEAEEDFNALIDLMDRRLLGERIGGRGRGGRYRGRSLDSVTRELRVPESHVEKLGLSPELHRALRRLARGRIDQIVLTRTRSGAVFMACNVHDETARVLDPVAPESR